jgi:hypothetical protein
LHFNVYVLEQSKNYLIKTVENGAAMKRITILSLILILALALAACSTKSNIDPNIPNTGIQPTQTPLPAVDEPSPVISPTQPSGSESPTEQPTQSPTQSVPVLSPTSTEQPRNGVPGIINESGVNLRMGPGFNYQVLKLMPKGLDVDVMGRSTNGVWLEVHLPDGSGGWAFAAYVDMQVAIANLPVSQAEGGPISEGPAGGTSGNNRLDVTIYILDNQATLQVNNFPANAEINASLGLSGKGADLTIANGKTDSSGSAELNFEMPAYWSNSKAIVESELLLVVSTKDGSFSRSIQVQYLRG